MRFLWLFIAMTVVLGSAAASAEYYQYTDENGNLHFTDDIAEIPESARSDAETFESVRTPAPISNRSQTPSANSSPPPGTTDTWDGKTRIAASELDRQRAELERIYEALRKQQRQLAERSPRHMSPEGRSAYQERLRELNDRIDAYEKKKVVFERHLSRFHAKLQRNPDIP